MLHVWGKCGTFGVKTSSVKREGGTHTGASGLGMPRGMLEH